MRKSYLVTGRFAVIDENGGMLTDQEFLNKIFIVSHPRAAQRQAIEHMKKRIEKKHGKGASFKQMTGLQIKGHERKTKVKKKQEATNQQRLF